jgi:glutathione synthase/RimK-type ligase-like ATP-grasp enzyme
MIAYLRRKEYEETDRKIIPFSDIFPVLYSEIEFRNGGAYVRNINLNTMDLFYFRAVGNAYDIVNSLLNIATEHNIPTVDRYLATEGAGPRTKEGMHNALGEYLLQPEFTMADSLSSVEDAARRIELEYPYVAKVSKGGRQGMGTFLVTEPDDIDGIRSELRRRHSEDEGYVYNGGRCPWIVQEYIPNNGDYRAFVIGDECIGVTKRGPKRDSLVLNKSSRGSRRFKNSRWPMSVGQLAINASRVMKVDIAGVDIVRHTRTGRLYVIEVNETPRFKSFGKVTGINVGGRIVDYLRGRIDGRE